MVFSLDGSVPVFTVFLQGLFSFLSPCVLPLIPLYIGYLSGGTGTVGESGEIIYNRRKVMVNTLFFVLGISFTFFLLGIGFSAMGTFFKSNQLLFARIGGIIVILFGLYQLGVFGKSNAVERERRLPFRFNHLAVSPITALIMGFTFSFAWTPCVGPALASVLLMTASAGTKTAGFLLIGVYTLGFVLPFLAVGLFTSTLLKQFKKHRNVVKYTVKIGGILMLLMGALMFTGKMNSLTGYLSKVSSTSQKTGSSSAKEKATSPDSKTTAPKEGKDSSRKTTEKSGSSEELPDLIDFTLKDQYGNTHTLSEYKGKTVFLNFWATWCPPCRAEMPDIQKLYESYQKSKDDSVVILGIAAPGYSNETSTDEVKKYLDDNGYTYPVLMDEGGEIFTKYSIFSYPTTYMFTKEGKVFGYASGQLNEDTMKNIIDQTLDADR